MNKQEVIKTIYGHLSETEDECSNGTFDQGYDQGCEFCIALIEQLDEPKKVIFSHEEKFVADWLDGLKGRISNKKLSSGAAFMVFVGQQLECLYYNEYTLITDQHY